MSAVEALVADASREFTTTGAISGPTVLRSYEPDIDIERTVGMLSPGAAAYLVEARALVKPETSGEREARRLAANADPATMAALDDLAQRRNGNDAELEHVDHADWQPVDLGPALRGERLAPVPTVFRRDDGVALFYPGLNGLHGDSGDGKSMVAAMAAVQELSAAHDVVWINLEDPNETTIVERLVMLGATDDQILERFRYLSPVTPVDDAAVDLVVELVTSAGATLTVLDSLGEAFALDGIDENHDAEVGPWMRRVLRRLDDTGTAVVAIDHSTKAKDNPLFASGSKRKRAAITGASYLLHVRQPLTRAQGGRLELVVAKDRHGNHERGKVAVVIELNVYPDDSVTWHLWPPTSTADAPADLGVQLAARSACEAASGLGEAAPRELLVESMAIKARATTKRAGIDLAVIRGALRESDGPRGSRLYTFVAPFEITR